MFRLTFTLLARFAGLPRFAMIPLITAVLASGVTAIASFPAFTSLSTIVSALFLRAFFAIF
jgi:hypothetical protein